MRENLKLIMALVVFLLISIIILPTIIERGGLTSTLNNNFKPSDAVQTVSDQILSSETYKFTKNNLNMRTGPGVENEVIITIPIGHKVKVIGHENGWDKVIYKESTGYSSSDYLSEYLEDDDDDEVLKGSSDTNLSKNPGVEVTEYMKEINGILLVNKEYGLTKNYYPGVNPEAKNQLEKMFSAAKKDIKKELVAFSGFRSYNYQQKLYNSYLVSEGKEDTSLYNAEPGHSEHQTGLAFDIGGEMKYWMDVAFAETIEGLWLRDNAHNFGFILRYPEGKTAVTGYGFEPWHFRYVGIDHATDIFKNNLTLEEYLLKSL